ncbi:NmrA/HSCARG family protein [Aspergillus fijiensis CBS 313.89]|uniref:NmrA family transcriptional regulator n=1 Tax=Aspergillus fijiensis CBS 313.89 TaxID=1448319 RepID=A0A8G1S237_9EURO|nr:nmrA family transcriptional regulator [Aspergillus fijiensis CBS 313.89]RAK82001.1 nmrA family transcriptional regulator [Aspergillus fijiensis CBS 313.89]
MSSDNRKVLVVFGATGTQGGSVLRAILSDPDTSRQFKVRAITRDPFKPAALALAQQGAEVVKASLNEKEEVYAALQGAYAVYLVTNMEGFDYAAETRQGKLVADVAKELDIKHLIWSSLPHISQITDSKLTGAVHWDGKAVVNDYIRSLAIPHTIINIGAYAPFIIDFFLAPLSTEPPTFSLCLPEPANITTVLPVVDAAADVGKFVKGILLRPKETIGKQLDVAERYYTVREIVETLNKLGRCVIFQTLPKETFKAALASRGLPEFFQEDLCQVFQYIEEYGYFHNNTLEEAREIASEPLISLEEAFRRHLEPVKLGVK